MSDALPKARDLPRVRHAARSLRRAFPREGPAAIGRSSNRSRCTSAGPPSSRLDEPSPPRNVTDDPPDVIVRFQSSGIDPSARRSTGAIAQEFGQIARRSRDDRRGAGHARDVEPPSTNSR
jgi:hypothetical protein